MVASSRAERVQNGAVAGDLIRLARPRQWAKNVLVISVPLLDLESWRPGILGRLGWAVVAFTIASALVYMLNDVVDRERDRLHPVNRHRPIAAGRLALPTVALSAAVLLLLLAVVLSSQPWKWAWPIGVYLLLNAAYSLGLKHVPLLDIFMVAAGFVLRLLQGYTVVEVAPAGWLLICVFSLCLLLIVGKRRHELVSTGVAHRPALRGYTVALTEQLMTLCAALTISSYLLYLRTEAQLGSYGPTAALLLTPFALLALFRYLQLALVRGSAGDPARTLLRDPVLVVNAVLWAGLSGGFLIASRNDLW
nr:UbiA prenyltransferase family protein [Micromonospora sp. DSM 115978]